MNQEKKPEIRIIQQFVQLVNNEAILVTWFRNDSKKEKAEKPVFIQEYEMQKLVKDGFIQFNHQIQNFR